MRGRTALILSLVLTLPLLMGQVHAPRRGVPVQAKTCGSTDKFSALSDDGVITCSTDSGGGTLAVREICFDAASLQPIPANDVFAPLEKDAGTNQDIFLRSFNDSVDDCVAGKFQAPLDMDTSGTVTYRWWWYPKTASANSACWDFKENGGLSPSTPATWDVALTLDAVGCHAGDSTQDEVVESSDTDSSIPWAVGEFVTFNFCRDGDGTQGTDNLSGDANLLLFCIEIPRT